MISVSVFSVSLSTLSLKQRVDVFCCLKNYKLINMWVRLDFWVIISHLFLNQYKPTESENSQWTFTWLWHTVEVCCHLLVMQVYYRRAADLYDNKKLITYGITYGVSPFKKYTCHFKWNALKLQCNYTLSQKLFFLFLNIKCPWITLSQEFNARSCLMGRLLLI